MRTFGPLIIASFSLLSVACGEKGPLVANAQTSQAQASSPASASAPTVGTAQLGHRELVARGAPLIDVRTPEEFAAGHVEGAVNIPVDQIGDRLTEIKNLVAGKNDTLVIYCRSGNRSAHAARTLRAEGYEVIDFGPMSAW